MPAGLVYPITVQDRASAAFEKIANATQTAAGAAERLDEVWADLSRAQQRAAMTGLKHVAAIEDVNKAMAETAGMSTKVQKAILEVVAAQDRLSTAMESGRATTASLAAAQSSLITAEERLAAAQKEVAESAVVAAGAQREAAVASKGLTGGLAGTVKMAGELGLVFGAFEVVKKGIDITKEASAYQRDMVQIANLTGASKTQVAALSSTLLKMSGKVAAAPEDLAISAYHAESSLRKLGATAPQIYRTVEAAAKGARIGNTDLEDTTNALTATMASGIVPFSQAGKAMGSLLAIVGAGDQKVSDLNDALSTGLLVTMKTFGVSLTDTGAALAVFGDNNIRGQDAATKLRLAVQDIAKPGADADAVLGKVGLTVDQLRGSLQDGGLNGALALLKGKLDAAGISGKQIGPFLEDAFTKRAGAGLAILLTRMDQFDEARKQVQKGGASFGQQWQNVTKTASFAFAQLGTEAQAEGIKIAQGVTPEVTALAKVLGVALPAAVDIAVGAAKPFVVAFKIGAAVIEPIAQALGAVASSAKPVGPVLKVAASGALALFAAMKVIAGIRAVFAGVSAALLRIGPAFQSAGIRANGFGRSLSGMLANVTGAQAAMGGLAIGLGVALYAWQEHQQEVAANKASIDEYTQSIQEDSGAIGSNTRSLAENNLVKAGAYQRALSLGISQKALTSAALGNAGALAQVNTQLDRASKSGDPVAAALVRAALTRNTGQLKTASQNANDMAAANGKVATTTNAATAAQARAAQAERVAAAQAKALNSALQNLAQTQLGAAQSEDQFREGILSLTQTIRTNHGELNKNTQAGLANRDALLNMLGSAVSLANAQKKNGASIDSVTTSLQGNVRQLIQTAVNAGLSRNKVEALVRQMGLTPKDIATKFHLDGTTTALTQLHNVRTQLAIIGRGVDSTVRIHTTGTAPNGTTVSTTRGVSYNATGGYISGPGTGTSDSIPARLSNGEFVINAKQTSKHLGLLRAINSGIRGFASGGIAGTQAWLRNHVNPLPYVFGSAGPSSYDCSGLVGAAIEKLTGRGHGRLFSTSNEGSVLRQLGFTAGPGSNAAMIVGWANGEGGLHHTTGSVGGLNFEAYGNEGVARKDQIRVGRNARSPLSFPHVMHLSDKAAGVSGAAAGPGGDKPGGGGSVPKLTQKQIDKVIGTGAYKAPSFSLGSVAGAASSAVNGGIAGATAPKPSGVGAAAASLTAGTARATRLTQVSMVANKTYDALAAHADKLKKQLADLRLTQSRGAAATRNQADALSAQAAKADKAAAAIKGNSKADKAARAAAEARAKSLRAQAAQLNRNATVTGRTGAQIVAALQKRAAAAAAAASKEKDAWGKAAQAAKAAQSAAQDAAKNLVDVLKSRVDALTQAVSAFRSSVAQGIAAGSDLATMWGKVTDAAGASASKIADLNTQILGTVDIGASWSTVTDAQATAAQNLADAQQAVNDAMPDTSALAAAQSAQAQAASQFAQAHTALLAAQQAVAAGQGTAAQYAALTAAQAHQSDTVQALAAANADLASAEQAVQSATGPTADQLKALADAQAAVQASGSSTADAVNGVVDAFRNQLTAAASFSTDITALVKAGLSTDLVQQIAAAGSTAGDALAKGILAQGPEVIAQLNDLGTQAGQTLAGAIAAAGPGSSANAAALQAQFNTTLAATQKFADDLSALTKAGAGQDLVSQVAAMGTDAGDALAQQLLAAGPSGIKALQDSMSKISNVADSEAAALAKGFYNAGGTALDNLVAAMQKRFPDIKAALAPLAAQLQAMFTVTPTAVVPGASNASNSTGSASKTVTISGHTTLADLAKKYNTTVTAIDALNPSLSTAGGAHAFNSGVKVNVPGFAGGVSNFGGGLAYVHADELVSLPRGSNVHTKRETATMLNDPRHLAMLEKIERRLASLEQHAENAPALTGQAVGAASVDGYRTAGVAAAKQNRRAARSKGAF